MNRMATRSLIADGIDREARACVYRINDEQYDGRMPEDEAMRLYQSCVHEIVTSRMRAELEPYRDLAAHHYLCSLVVGDECPPELKQAMDGIITKWTEVLEELA